MNFTIEPRPYGDPDVVRMVSDVQAEYEVRYGGPDKATVDADEFVPPAGLFLVGRLDGIAVAMSGWRRLGDEVAEIKRMYVAASARRRGLARLMLAETERTALEAGITRMLLMTGIEQPEAIALYTESGYKLVAPFGHYASYAAARFYGRSLESCPPSDTPQRA